jgi:protein-S-isoprenylcysteine O-methyltransferase Ste14
MKILRLKIPPVIVTLAFAFCMWQTAKLLPDFTLCLPLRYLVAFIISFLGWIFSLIGVMSFISVKTTVNPLNFNCVSSLVVTGIYSVTRNPMYLGLFFVLLGWFYFLSNIVCFIYLPLFVLYMNYFQIIPEESYLEARYGRAFILYRSKVRRWL